MSLAAPSTPRPADACRPVVHAQPALTCRPRGRARAALVPAASSRKHPAAAPSAVVLSARSWVGRGGMGMERLAVPERPGRGRQKMAERLFREQVSAHTRKRRAVRPCRILRRQSSRALSLAAGETRAYGCRGTFQAQLEQRELAPAWPITVHCDRHRGVIQRHIADGKVNCRLDGHSSRAQVSSNARCV
jgi:hypothetical protein